MNLTSERVDDLSQGPDRRAGCRLESAEQKGKVEPARRLQLRLEIATLPSLYEFSRSGFVRPALCIPDRVPSQVPAPIKVLIAALAAARTSAALQLDN